MREKRKFRGGGKVRGASGVSLQRKGQINGEGLHPLMASDLKKEGRQWAKARPGQVTKNKGNVVFSGGKAAGN